MTAFSEAFRAARAAAGLNQREVARLLGVSPQYLNDVEFGRRPLADAHFPQLPAPIRQVAIAERIAELRERIAALKRI